MWTQKLRCGCRYGIYVLFARDTLSWKLSMREDEHQTWEGFAEQRGLVPYTAAFDKGG